MSHIVVKFLTGICQPLENLYMKEISNTLVHIKTTTAVTASTSTPNVNSIMGEVSSETDDVTENLMQHGNDKVKDIITEDTDTEDTDTETEDQPVNLIIGEENCTFQHICDIVRPRDCSELLERWTILADAFGLSREFIHVSKRNLKLETAHITDVFVDMLTHWKSQCSSKATVAALVDILHQHGFETMTQNLRTAFGIEHVEHRILVSKRIYTTLVGFLLFMLFAAGAMVFTLLVTPEGPKYRSTVPFIPLFYIPRHLQARSVLDNSTIFNNLTSTDILVFQGAGFQLITKLAKQKDTQHIEDALRYGINSQYITGLVKISEFEGLCKIRASSSLHWINFYKNLFIWVRTCGDFSSVSSWVNSNSSLVFEDEVRQLIRFQNHTSPQTGWDNVFDNLILIVGEIGVGKSTLLANIGAKTIESEPSTIVMFSDFNTFINKVKQYVNNKVKIERAVLKVITDTKCLNLVCRKLLLNNFNGSLKLLVLLDGFNQIPVADHELGFLIAKAVKQFNSTFVIVTSRSYLLPEIESNLFTLAYNLVTLNETSQADLLAEFWNSKHTSLNASCLQEFANLTVNYLTTKLTNTEQGLAGVALTTVLIAEVYELNAITYADNANILYECNGETKQTFNVTSLHMLFETIVNKKIRGVYTSTNDVRHQMFYHSYKAIATIFVNETIPDKYESSFEVVQKIGLLERYDETDNLKFIHPSFIDYFTSWYFLNCELDDLCIRLSNKYFAVIPFNVNFCSSDNYTGYYFSEKLFVYFFGSAANLTKDAKYLNLNKFNKTSLLVAATHDNFLTLLDLLKSHINANNYELLYKTSVMFSSDVYTVNEVLGRFNYSDIGRLSQLNFEFGCEILQAQYLSLLHLAILRGNKNIIKYFLKLERLDAWGTHFLQFLVLSYEDLWLFRSKEHWVDSSIEIANMLVQLDPFMLEDFDGSICTPLYYTKTYNMLAHLLEQGADPNAFCLNERCMTQVLYRLVSEHSFSAKQLHDIVQKLYDKNHLSPELVNKDFLYMYASQYEPLNQTLFVLKESGVVFDDVGMKHVMKTMLVAAIKTKKSRKSIELITQYQTNWKVTFENAFTSGIFLAATFNNIDALDFFIKINTDDIKRDDILCILTYKMGDNLFYGVVQTLLDAGANPQSECWILKVTPVHISAQHGTLKIFEAIVDKCEFINKTDVDRNTVLHYAIGNWLSFQYCGPSVDQALIVEQIIRDRLVDLNARNRQNFTAIEAAAFMEEQHGPTLLLDTMFALITKGKVILTEDSRSWLFRKAMQCPTPYVYNSVYDGPDEIDYTRYVDSIQFHNVNHEYKDKASLLHVAYGRACVNGVKYLINNGVDVNVLDEHGHTVLYYLQLNYNTLSDREKQIYVLLKRNGARV